MRTNHDQSHRKYHLGIAVRRFVARASRVWLLAIVVAGAVVGCDWPDMRPGERCGRCHDGGDATRFSVAGTVYASPTADRNDGIKDVTLDLIDANGRSVSLSSNDSGNFYTEQRLVPPLQVTLSRAGSARVSSVAPNGDCNSCHTGGASLGRLYLQ